MMFSASIPFVGRTGMDIIELSPGKVKSIMPAAGNQNHVQIMYAGALFTLAEISGAALIGSVLDLAQIRVVVSGMKIDYHKAFKKGEDAYVQMSAPADLKDKIMKGLADGGGKTAYDLEIPISSADGEVRATSVFTYHFKKTG